ncbi:MAG: response regulator [Desulfotalea sp.]
MSEKIILVVDDSPTDRQIAKAVCEGKGFKVETAEEGEQAYKKAAEFKPDLILLDVILPQKNGFQVCRQIKKDENLKDIAIILVTSKSQESDKFWGKQQGADAYLTKPYTDEELSELIDKFIN